MGIQFEPKRWDEIRKTYMLWWEGKLDRPIVPVILSGRDPGRKKPDTPLLSQETCADLSIPAGKLIDRIDYELSTHVFLGDSFPFVNLSSFGPGLISAFLGADLDNTSGRVWFHAKEVLPVTDLHFEYNPNNVWLCRIKEICHEAMKRWQGQVLVGMPDIGGVMDILSVFRPGENLLLDLYDHPEEVIRLIWEIHELWHRFYQEINDVLQPVNPGYTDWSEIYCDRPSYILQDDFCYMISPGMFDEFALPELKASCDRLACSIYHLDGVGQLAHLDSLLKIENLNAVQWVPGDGKPPQSEWPDVLRKISDAGKGLFTNGGFDSLNRIISCLGTGKGISNSVIYKDVSRLDEVKKQLRKYGIE